MGAEECYVMSLMKNGIVISEQTLINGECCWLITSFDVVGKDQAIKLKAIETLLPFLHHIEPRIQAFGIAALMRYLKIAFYSQFILFV